jgi:hypothetical protein
VSTLVRTNVCSSDVLVPSKLLGLSLGLSGARDFFASSVMLLWNMVGNYLND